MHSEFENITPEEIIGEPSEIFEDELPTLKEQRPYIWGEVADSLTTHLEYLTPGRTPESAEDFKNVIFHLRGEYPGHLDMDFRGDREIANFAIRLERRATKDDLTELVVHLDADELNANYRRIGTLCRGVEMHGLGTRNSRRFKNPLGELPDTLSLVKIERLLDPDRTVPIADGDFRFAAVRPPDDKARSARVQRPVTPTRMLWPWST